MTDKLLVLAVSVVALWFVVGIFADGLKKRIDKLEKRLNKLDGVEEDN